MRWVIVSWHGPDVIYKFYLQTNTTTRATRSRVVWFVSGGLGGREGGGLGESMDDEDREYGLSAVAYISASFSAVSGDDHQNQVFQFLPFRLFFFKKFH